MLGWCDRRGTGRWVLVAREISTSLCQVWFGARLTRKVSDSSVKKAPGARIQVSR